MLYFDLTGDHAIVQGETWTRVFYFEDPRRIVTIAGGAGGSFLLRIFGAWTAPIDYSSASASVLLALQRIPIVGPTGITSVTGSAGGPWTITIAPKLLAKYGSDPGTLIADGAGLVAYGGSIDVTNAPLDLTGYTARMMGRRKEGDAYTLFSWTSSDILSIQAAAGSVTATVPAATSLTYGWRKGVYDLELVSSGGLVGPKVKGKIEVEEEVTR